MKCRGKGDYQEILDSLNRLKVIHKLSIKPYSYETLWSETRIQRNRLRSILNDFIKRKMIISHKFTSTSLFENEINKLKIVSGLIYLILDIDNKETLRYLRDIELDTFVKDRVIIGKIFSKEIKRIQTKRQIQTIRKWRRQITEPRIRLPNEAFANKNYEEVKIVQNMDPTFSPLLYLPPEQRGHFYTESDKYSIFTRLKEQDPELYHKYLMFKNEHRITYKNTLRQNYDIELKQVKEIADSWINYKSMDLSRYDLLIILSYSFPSRLSYIKIWDLIESLKFDYK